MVKSIITNQSFEGAGGNTKFPDLEFIAMIEVFCKQHHKPVRDANPALLEAVRKLENISSPSIFGVEYKFDRYHQLANAYGNVYAIKR